MPSNPPDEIWLNMPQSLQFRTRMFDNEVKYVVATPARENAEKLVAALKSLVAGCEQMNLIAPFVEHPHVTDGAYLSQACAALKLCEEQPHDHHD